MPKGVSNSKKIRLIKKYGCKCGICNIELNLEEYNKSNSLNIGHIIPKSKGGGDNIENLRLLCKGCNSGKRDRDHKEILDKIEKDVLNIFDNKTKFLNDPILTKEELQEVIERLKKIKKEFGKEIEKQISILKIK